jgi:lysozyme family protein
MSFTEDFQHAFDHAMIYEVGPFFNSADPETIAGLCVTREQRRKVGYVNDPVDTGGETKYGVAKNANTDLDIKTLDLAGAMNVYFHKYWLRGQCDKLPYPVSLIHFDGCVNHGVGRAAKFLQIAVGAVADGAIGPKTLTAANQKDPLEIVKSIATQRRAFYNAIVASNPPQVRFLTGWLRRINEVETFTLKAV